MPRKFVAVSVIAMAVALSACGTTQSDRALSGGLLGAGTGAVIGSFAGGAGTGALIGGLGGAALGAFSSPHAINLGKPIWRSGEGGGGRSARHHYACHQVASDERVCHRVASR